MEGEPLICQPDKIWGNVSSSTDGGLTESRGNVLKRASRMRGYQPSHQTLGARRHFDDRHWMSLRWQPRTTHHLPIASGPWRRDSRYILTCTYSMYNQTCFPCTLQVTNAMPNPKILKQGVRGLMTNLLQQNCPSCLPCPQKRSGNTEYMIAMLSVMTGFITTAETHITYRSITNYQC